LTQSFSNRTVIITGSSRGIGAALAHHMAEAGCRVAITYSSNPEAADKVLKGLPGTGHICVQLNVADEEQVISAFDKVLAEFGHLDFLVNNAGITRDQLLLRMKSDDFQAVLDTNLRGTFLCTKQAVKLMLKAKKAGSIVNITSVVGQTGNAGQANYSASKAGAEAFTKSVALEVAARGIRLNCVAPGFIVTEMTDVLSEQQKQSILDRIPLKSLGDVADVANAVSFLLSDKAKYITGQTLSVNGGMYMS
jgi:3-oxoacyl-[acyl-carrier protein] reductase